MSWIDRVKATSIVCISIVISFMVVEYSYRYIIDASAIADSKKIITLFEVGNNLRNHDGYFKYFPNKEFRRIALYLKSSPKSIEDLVIEYDYVTHTNNVGLVMQKDVFPNERAIFLIGDSYTEGQGASPWFYDLEKSNDIANAKILNLGILGTGPQQWENLASSISKELRLDVLGTVVNIIPADMDRDVWMFKEQELTCLYHASCDYDFGFQGYKFRPQESYDDIKRSVLNNMDNPKPELDGSKIKNIMKKSHVIVDLYRFFKQIIPSQSRKLNEISLLALNKAVSGNLYVNVVSQKYLNSRNLTDHKNATRLIEFLQKYEIKYKWCDIPFDGYHKYDGHPNGNGYKILRKCTRDALEKLDFALN